MQEQRPKVEVVANFLDFRSHIDYCANVATLLGFVPGRYLAGLDRVVLRDSAGLTRSEKLRSRKRRARILGTYHRATHDQRAQIHLFIDKIVGRWSPLLLRLAWFRELLIAQVLYHEIGHHIHERIAPEHRDGELTANDWRSRLGRDYMRRRHWYLRPFWKPLGFILLRLRSYVRRRRATAKGSRSS